MATGRQGAAPGNLQDLFQSGAVGRSTDGELLERFVRRDGTSAEGAFAALVERHGPMVLGVCRALLGDVHEAEDAFQATFLVLARRAGSIREPELLANWLYGVAHRTARKARAQVLRRRSREIREGTMSALDVVDRGDQHDVTLAHREQARLIHQELGRLPEKHRSVVVLCYLEGLTVEESARRLRCTPGAVRGRLAQARSRLRERLARRGVAVAPAILAGLLSAQRASAAVPPGLKDVTTRAALSFIGKAAAPGAASATVVAMARSVLRLGVLSSLRLPASVLLTLAAAGVGVVALTSKPPHPKAAQAPALKEGTVESAVPPGGRPAEARQFIERLDWTLSAVDPGRRFWIAVETGKGRAAGKQALSLVQFRGRVVQSGLTLVGLRVAPDGTVTVDGRRADLDQLRQGMLMNVELSRDRLAVVGIRARSEGTPPAPFVQVIDEVDAAGRTLSFSVPESTHRLEKVRVAEDAAITRLDARPDAAIRLGKLDLKDLRAGMPVSIGLEIGEDGRPLIRSVTCAAGDDGKEKTR